MKALDTLLSIAVDLTAMLSAKDRYLRLLEALQKVIPYDAAALMRIDGDLLIPMAARGLSGGAIMRAALIRAWISYAIPDSRSVFQPITRCPIPLTVCWSRIRRRWDTFMPAWDVRCG